MSLTQSLYGRGCALSPLRPCGSVLPQDASLGSAHSGAETTRFAIRQVVVEQHAVEQEIELAVILPSVAGVGGKKNYPSTRNRNIENSRPIANLRRTPHQPAQH